MFTMVPTGQPHAGLARPLQLSPKWRCNILQKCFATFANLGLQKTAGDKSKVSVLKYADGAFTTLYNNVTGDVSDLTTITDGGKLLLGIESTNGNGYKILSKKLSDSSVDDYDENQEITGELTGAHLKGYSVILGGTIGVNYYMTLSDDIINDESAHMHFILPDGSTQDAYVKDADAEENNANVSVKNASGTGTSRGNYIFSCQLAAPEMASEIQATFVTDTASSDTYTYSVEKYAEYILNNESKYDADLIRLVKAMLNYGAYAQKYFGYNTASLANRNLRSDDQVLQTETDATKIKSNKSIATTESGLDFYGTSLVLRSNTALRVYFTLADAGSTGTVKSLEDYSFKWNSNAVTPKKVNTKYYVELSNVSPADYDKENEMTVDGDVFATYSVNDYVCDAVNATGPSTNMKNLAYAIYEYGEAAKAYFEL